MFIVLFVINVTNFIISKICFINLLNERNDSTKQFLKFDNFLCFCDKSMKRKSCSENENDEKIQKNKSKWTKQNMKKKLKNENNEYLIFYLNKNQFLQVFFDLSISHQHSYLVWT